MSTKTIFVMLISVFFSLPLHAQEQPKKKEKKERTIRLYGHVYDSFTHAGISDVFITLMRADSSVVDTVRTYAYRPWNTTKADAQYHLNIPARPAKYIIRAEHPDYETAYVDYDIRSIARNTYFDAPWHQMKRLPKNYDKEGGTLGEVTVRATKVKIVYKGDTVVYNADAFNLPDGSMLEDLIRQLDGVTLKDNGQILVNGQPIDELTLNGREFFKGNNKVMLENLPHYIVDQVKVYHKTTEVSEYLGYDKEQKKYVMDVVLKREYAQGWIFNAEMAGGSPMGEDDIRTGKDFDNRFLARLFAMRYTDNSRLSFFANTNNVNENRRPGSDGEWSPSNMPRGETVNRQAGTDLLIDQAEKKWKEHMQTEIQWTDTRSYRFQNDETFLADNPSVFRKSTYSSRGKNINLNAQNTFSLNKPFRMENTTYFRYRKGRGDMDDRSAQLNGNLDSGQGRSLLDSIYSASLNPAVRAQLVNSNWSRQKTRNRWMEFSSRFDYDHKLPNGDNLSVEAGGTLSRSKNKDFLWHQISYYQPDGKDDFQNRHGNTSDKTRDIYLKGTYTFNFLNGLHITPEYMVSHTRNRPSDLTYRLDRLAGWGSSTAHPLGSLPSAADSLLMVIDTGNSHQRTFTDEQHQMGADLQYVKEKDGKYINFTLMLPVIYHNRRLHYASAFTDTTAVSRTWAFSPQLFVTCAWNNWMRYLYANYNVENNLPDLYNTINVRHDTDPLNVRLGNPALKRSVAHRMQVGYTWRTNAHKMNHNFGYGLRFFLRQVSQGYTYDTATGAYTYRPVNVDGNWQTYFWNNYSQTLDPSNRLSVNLYTHGDYTRAVDMAATDKAAGSRLTHADNYYLQQTLSLTYQHEQLTLGASGQVEWRNTSNREHTIKTINAVNFSYGPRLVYTFPFKLSVATDMRVYARRGYGDASLNTTDWVWNASLTQPLIKGKLVAKLEGFDILGHLSNTQISIDGLGRREISHNTLPRYVMLHLTYKFNKLPKNKK